MAARTNLTLSAKGPSPTGTPVAALLMLGLLGLSPVA